MTNNYYQKHKERLQKEALERYQNVSENGPFSTTCKHYPHYFS